MAATRGFDWAGEDDVVPRFRVQGKTLCVDTWAGLFGRHFGGSCARGGRAVGEFDVT